MPNLSDVNPLRAKDLWPVSIGFVLALFSHRQLPRFSFTDHCTLTTLLSPLFSRHSSLATLLSPLAVSKHTPAARRPSAWATRGPASHSRVAGRYCYLPAPSELDVRVAPHPAQAFTNAPCGTRS